MGYRTSQGDALLMHILRVACIDHGDGVALYLVGVVPLVGVRHVAARPSANGGTAAGQRPLNGVDGEEGIAHVALHVLVGVGVAVLLGHVPVEASDLGGCALRVEILILHLSRRR